MNFPFMLDSLSTTTLVIIGVVCVIIILAAVFFLFWEHRRKILNEIKWMEKGHKVVCTKLVKEWNKEDFQAVKLACMMSAYRNSTRDNNVCRSLAIAFSRFSSAIGTDSFIGEYDENDIKLMKEHLNYWAWSLGEGEKPKLFSLPR